MVKKGSIKILYILSIGLFIGFLILVFFRKKGLEHFTDTSEPDSEALRAVNKILKKYTKLKAELEKKKITYKDNFIENVFEELNEMADKYKHKDTTSDDVTHSAIREKIKKYVQFYNKIIKDYNLDLLNIKFEDILDDKPLEKQATYSERYKSTDTYQGEFKLK